MVSPTSRADPLGSYRKKRRFDRTPEPKGRQRKSKGRLYTIQKHDARRLHYDLRLELDGVLKSWAVTRGPSLDPSEKRLAVRTEDHPVEYATFEGRIPEGNYGAGTVLLWDRGSWEPVDDPHEGLEKGKLVFELRGERLQGRWALVRFKGDGRGKRENWLLIKERDDKANHDADVTGTFVLSVVSGRDLDEIAADPRETWDAAHGGRASSDRPSPGFVEPALATLVDDVPGGPGWLFEVKFDGYRALSSVTGAAATIYTRGGLDWTYRYPSIARALSRLDLDRVMLDGEIVAFDSEGRSDFSALHRALERGGRGGLAYFVFDLLAEAGESLREMPLSERKERLLALLGTNGREGPVFFTDHVAEAGDRMLRELCRSGHEGIIAKRAGAPYRSGRGRNWLKIKCGRDQEFVIIGWWPSSADRPFASLLLATRAGGRLQYAGRVGSGFTESDLQLVSRRLRQLERKTPPAADSIPASVRRQARWARPELVAQIAFAEFTRDGLVRQGRFLGLREDKPAGMVTREVSEESGNVQSKREASDGEVRIAGVRLTHPDRVLYPQQGVTKRELAKYLESAAERMLPFVSGRLLSLVRCPRGREKKCFFQRHGGAGLSDWFRRLTVAEKDGGEEEYLHIEDTAALVEAAQMGVLEFHIWGSRVDDIDKPDRLVFDLDPDPSVGFEEVKRAAVLMRDALGALDLESFPLLTGGKGIHVVAPLTRRHGWATVKGFAGALAERFVEDDPDRFVATMSKARRKGRIFIDYFRNDRMATAIAPYSPRAREGAPLAWPVDWNGLDAIAASDAHRLRGAGLDGAAPWKDYGKMRQSLKAASLRALGVAED